MSVVIVMLLFLNTPVSLSLSFFEESTEDLCVGCHTLLPLNHTLALDFVHASLATFNNNTENQTFALQEVGRMMSQVNQKGSLHIIAQFFYSCHYQQYHQYIFRLCPVGHGLLQNMLWWKLIVSRISAHP